MAKLRLRAAIGLGKASGLVSRRLGRGGGTALPGLVALRLAPSLIRDLSSQLSRGSVLVTGTNGKTTTSRMLSSILRHADFSPLHNRSGSNLLRGLATSLLQEADLAGGMPNGKGGIGLFEVDEATLPQAILQTHPRVIVFTNLFRDQLDRYGEVDWVAGLWRQALAGLPEGAKLVLNSDDPLVAGLAANSRCPAVYYGVEDVSGGLREVEHAADSRRCPTCGGDYQYSASFYGHIGHYRCPRCNTQRPQPHVAAVSVRTQGAAGSEVDVLMPGGRPSLRTGLPGIYNVYNLLAATAAAYALGIPLSAIESGLASVTAAFGRVEKVPIGDRTLFLVLAKNPAGLNEVIRTLTSDPEPKPLLLALNDGIADGQDVSWIWDADFEKLRGKVRFAVASGRRAQDMALRLKYAGVAGDAMAPLSIENDLARAIQQGLERIGPGETLYVVPTYTAMLQAQEILTAWGHLRPYWARA